MGVFQIVTMCIGASLIEGFLSKMDKRVYSYTNDFIIFMRLNIIHYLPRG